MTWPPDTGDLKELRAEREAAREAARQAAALERQQQGAEVVRELYEELASHSTTADELKQTMDAVQKWENSLNARAASMGVTEYSELEKVYVHASDTLMVNYTASHSVYAQSGQPEDYSRMLKDGQAYVNAKWRGLNFLQDRLDSPSQPGKSSTSAPVQESARRNPQPSSQFESVAQAVQATQPSGSQSTTHGDRRPPQPPADTSHYSSNTRQKRGPGM